MLLDSSVQLPEDGGCRVCFRMQRDPTKWSKSFVCAQSIPQVLLEYFEDASSAGGRTFYQHLHVHNTMAR
jgi:hypothetical protein